MPGFKGSQSPGNVLSVSLIPIWQVYFFFKIHQRTTRILDQLVLEAVKYTRTLPRKKPAAFWLHKGLTGFVVGTPRGAHCSPFLPGKSMQELWTGSGGDKNLPTYGDTKSFCMRKAEIPHKYHKILCRLQSSTMSMATNMDCFQTAS